MSLLEIDDLSVHFPIRQGLLRQVTGHVRAVNEVNLSVAAGETVGLVGESGCGKSTLGRAILGLRNRTAGRIRFGGIDMPAASRAARTRFRREMQLIFQDPYSALDPQATIGASIRAGLDIHRIGTRAERRRQVIETMRRVGLDPGLRNRYPHEFSGGMRQRVVVARALITRPKFVVCDEPTSALDVSIQAQIINMLMELKAQLGLTLLFISHDLAVVDTVADRIAVMYLGRIVEIGARGKVFSSPGHPYSQALLSSIPVADPNRRVAPALIDGDVPSPSNLPQGCAFRGRCPRAKEICARRVPPMMMHGPNQNVACWNPLGEESAERP